MSKPRMVLSKQNAMKILSRIQDATFQRGLKKHFRNHIYRDEDGKDQVKVQGICWLYCWASADGSRRHAPTARQAREAFNQIFDPSYDWLPPELLETAYDLRYKTRDVEQEFLAVICGSNEISLERSQNMARIFARICNTVAVGKYIDTPSFRGCKFKVTGFSANEMKLSVGSSSKAITITSDVFERRLRGYRDLAGKSMLRSDTSFEARRP